MDVCVSQCLHFLFAQPASRINFLCHTIDWRCRYRTSVRVFQPLNRLLCLITGRTGYSVANNSQWATRARITHLYLCGHLNIEFIYWSISHQQNIVQCVCSRKCLWFVSLWIITHNSAPADVLICPRRPVQTCKPCLLSAELQWTADDLLLLKTIRCMIYARGSRAARALVCPQTSRRVEGAIL